VDIALYLRVLWRFRILVLAGLVLALCLAFLSYAKPTQHGLAYRQHEQWQSQAVILVTQARFPEGRSTQEYLPADPAKGLPAVPVGDTARLASLAVLYSEFANSDRVRQLVRDQGPVDGSIVASAYVPATAPQGTLLPLISIAATSDSPKHAVALAGRGSEAFIEFIRDQQAAAEIPKEQRVLLQVLTRPEEATLLAGRKKTVPIIVFLTVMIAAVGLAFILENLRPRIRGIDDEQQRTTLAVSTRRSA
jgi:hypothetical protein